MIVVDWSKLEVGLYSTSGKRGVWNVLQLSTDQATS